MLYKCGKHTRNFLAWGVFIFYCSFVYFVGVFDKTIIPLLYVGYEMIIANLATCLVGYMYLSSHI